MRRAEAEGVVKPARYLWLVHDATGTATRVRVLRLWRWRGEATTRRGVYVAPGYVTRVVVDYVGTRRTLTLRQPRTHHLCAYDVPCRGSHLPGMEPTL